MLIIIENYLFFYENQMKNKAFNVNTAKYLTK